jgi:vancomycin resistance protein VanJ
MESTDAQESPPPHEPVASPGASRLAIPRPNRWRTWGAYGLLALSLLLHFGVVLCITKQWDAVTAATIFPIWIWAIGGCCLAFLSRAFRRTGLVIAVSVIWIITAVVMADETTGLRRIAQAELAEEHPPLFHGKTVYRIATINCSKRNAAAMREVARFHPDIVLLQEVPILSDIKALTQEMFGMQGQFLTNNHCAVIAKGTLQRVRSSIAPAPPYEQVVLTLDDGRQVELFSAHLAQAVTRWDLWNPECWRAHRENRQQRRSQLIHILNQHAAVSITPRRPCIIGGDFNAPAADITFDHLRRSFRDTFRTAGRGWGNTFHNRFPALRIDQIWATPEIIPLNARVVGTENSDHRMLVVDFILNG